MSELFPGASSAPATASSPNPTDCLSDGGEMGAMMRSFDWTSSPLGPVAGWPQSLRTMVSTVLNSRFPVFVWWGPKLCMLYNDAYKQILGAKHPAALGRPGLEVWPEIWPFIGPMLDGVLQRGESTWSENQILIALRHGFAEECYFTFSYSPIRNEGGGVGGIFTVVTETTGQVLGERRLRALRDLGEQVGGSTTRAALSAAVHDVLESHRADIPFSILRIAPDDDGQHAVATETGLARALGSVEAATLQELPPLADIEALEALLGARLELAGDTRPTRIVTLPIAAGAQSARAGTLVVGLSPLLLYDDRYKDFLDLVAKQIGGGLATVQVLEDSQKRAEALAEIDRAKTAFFSNVSHEFRTPLTLMLGPIEEAASTGAPLDGEPLAAVNRNALRLLKLVNTLLDFSRIEAGRVKAQFAATDLATLTADLASAFRSAIDRAGLRFDVSCPPLSSPAFVDHDMWEKIVLNLLSNALKFTFDGSIAIALAEEDDAFVLRVSDTGTGIPAKELPSLFARFHRVQGARARTHEGSGIGLALANELVLLHGGRIDAESDVGRGTRFTIRIPKGSAHLPDDQLAPHSTGVASATGAAAFVTEALRWLPDADGGVQPANDVSVDRAAHGRILVADDNADMRDYLKRLLSPRWHVETAPDGQAALALARVQPFDVILSDVMMPRLDGFGLLRELRTDARTRDVPFVMLSARAGEEAHVEGLHAGADDYLVKPFAARELLARVESQMARVKIRAIEERHTRRLARVFQHAPVGICIFRGPSHVFDFANADYLELVSGRDILGKPIRQALPELASQGIPELLDEVYRTGEPHVGRSLRLVINRGPGGAPEECFFDFVYDALRDENDRVEGVIVVGFEVTELARARRDAEAASRAKDEFLAMLGHELRNPLAPIVTALQLVKLRGGMQLSKEQEVIERQVEHLVRLVDDLLDISKITRGKVQLDKRVVELGGVVARAVEIASPLFEHRGHRLTIDVPRKGMAIDVDATRMAQVIANLLTNAAKYTEPGGNVQLHAWRDGHEIVVQVKDDGIGIAPELLPHVFDLFVQGYRSSDRGPGGLGIGLALVRNLVALHGGTVVALSGGDGKGSAFVVRLPGAGEAAVVSAPPAAPPPAGTRTHSPQRVLVVDDNEDAAELLAEMLTTVGHEVVVAHDGLQALSAIERFIPDVAVLDIGLPVMDGYELAVKLRERLAERPPRMMAVTGYGQEHDRVRSQAARFELHFVKPVMPDQLLAAIETRR